MSQPETWRRKLDPVGRLQLEDGLPAAGVDVTVRLTSNDQAAAHQVEQTGLRMHGQIDDIVVGHVSNALDLQHIAELPCVHEVQVARPLYADEPRTSQEAE